jgi:hypothetical protein
MRSGSPFEALHEALASACKHDLPDINYQIRDKAAKRRPRTDDVEVTLFSQGWGDTSLGYGGIGGQAMTSAYTVVISDLRNICVYFGCGRLAYKLNLNEMSPKGREAFQQDLASFNLVGVWDLAKYK